MAQHFLLSAQARELSLMKIMKMSDTEAFETFKIIRWSETDGEPVCPCCGSTSKPYFLKTRMQYRCKECFHTFSVTSGTLFAHHKLSLQTYLLAIALFTNAVKSISALQLSRDLDVQYKTAWVLTHKIRESLMEYNLHDKFEGTVEMDAAWSMFAQLLRYKQSIDPNFQTSDIYIKDDMQTIRKNLETFTEPNGEVRHKRWLQSIKNGDFLFGSQELSYMPKGVDS